MQQDFIFMKNHFIFINNLIILFSISFNLCAQEWEFAKEKDGIKVYTREEPGSSYKAFKGEVELTAEMAQVSLMLEDVEQFDVWDEDVSEIRLLAREQGKYFKYYVVYNSPWPVSDRDLCVEATITDDPKTGVRLFQAKSVPEAMPEDEDLVRIIHYWQKWIIQPRENGKLLLTVEGYADPAGDVPAWLANMVITDTPLNMLKAIREDLR